MHRIVCFLALFVLCAAYNPLLSSSPFNLIYNVSDGEPTPWYVNDHTVIAGPGGTWHILGITHTEPADPIWEVNLAHAVLNTTTITPNSQFSKAPFAMGTYRVDPWQETHLWAPHIVLYNGIYYMFYCAGGVNQNDSAYYINLATSTDLYNWERVSQLFQDGWDARDPMVINLGPAFNNLWAMYYCATVPNSGAADVQHVDLVRTSSDLINWSEATVVFDAGPTGSPYGGPTESPFVVRRNSSFYLFNGAWSNYSDTKVWLSSNPFWFGNISDPNNQPLQVGEIPSHALEVVRDTSGNWYVTRCGWGQGGVFLSQIKWLDDLDNASTSMPPPPIAPPISLNFKTSLSGFQYNDGQWIVTPTGLQAGSALSDSFFMSSTFGSDFTLSAEITIMTNDGNPTSSPGPWTRDGSAAALIFRSQSTDVMSGCYAVNLFTNLGGGVKLFKFPYEELSNYTLPIQPATTYVLVVAAHGSNLQVSFAPLGAPLRAVISIQDLSFASGLFGLNVWQGSALFQNVMLL